MIHPEALRQDDHSDGCRQINNGTQRLCACLSEYRGTRAAPSLTHPEQVAHVTSLEHCKSMERQTVAQPANVMHKFMCQGVENGEDIFDPEKQPGEPRVVVQQEEVGCVAEEIILSDQHVQMEHEPQQQQHASIPEPSAIPPQPYGSIYQNPMQVNTTPRRARIPEDEGDTRTVRTRLEMSTLIRELCERDVPGLTGRSLMRTTARCMTFTLD